MGRSNLFAILFAFIAMGMASGCTVPVSVPPLGPGTAPQSSHVVAQYTLWYWSACPNHLVTYEKDGDAYTQMVECMITPTPVAPSTITEAHFNEQVYVTDAFLDDPSPYAEIPVGSISAAPAGTSKCYQTPDTVYTLCHDDSQVVTYEYYNGMALGIYDVNFQRVLVSYLQE